MIVGYVLEHILGLILSARILLNISKGRYEVSIRRRCLDSFQECATFFAFAIEIAAIAVLIQEDLGISTSGMGDDTVRITQSVAMLVLAPLLYPLLTPSSELTTVRCKTDWLTKALYVDIVQ